jgi:aspergillopepsin I
MPRFNHLLVWATTCLTASANPLKQLAARGSFTLQQVAVEPTEPTTLEEIVARHYWKFGFEAPKPIEQLIQNYGDGARSRIVEPSVSGSGTVAAVPVEGDKMYLIETQVGKHKMRLDLDTGSADLYVYTTPL